MKNKLWNNKGLTLIELIITIALLGIIISFMFTFFQFNYSTFFRSNRQYNVQTSLNNCARLIEEELRFADAIKIHLNKVDFCETKNYIYLDDSIIKIKTMGNESKSLMVENIIIADKPCFQLDGNLLTFQIKGQSPKNKEEFIIKSTIELLNFKNTANEIEGSIIEYTIKGDD